MKFLPLIFANLRRRLTGTILTGLSVAATIFIFATLVALDQGMDRMINSTGQAEVITVFERYKACPPYSALPVHYAAEIAELDGVADVMAVRFLMSNCQTTTDLVAVHGVEPDKFRSFDAIEVSDPDYRAFTDEKSAALVGSRVAEQYEWKVGQQVILEDLRGIPFVIRGIFKAPGSTLDAVILVDREYLETSIQEIGRATMFRVLVADGHKMADVSRRIDEMFANRPKPTRSGPEREFIAHIIDDFSGMLHFSQVVAYLALLLLFAIMVNSISISVRGRGRELAVMRTLGYSQRLLVALIVAEASVISTGAAALGCATGWAVLHLTRFSLSVEGYTIVPHLSWTVAGLALLAGLILGVLGALPAALRAVREPIVEAMGEVNG